jgi:hypothetical protein
MQGLNGGSFARPSALLSFDSLNILRISARIKHTACGTIRNSPFRNLTGYDITECKQLHARSIRRASVSILFCDLGLHGNSYA